MLPGADPVADPQRREALGHVARPGGVQPGHPAALRVVARKDCVGDHAGRAEETRLKQRAALVYLCDALRRQVVIKESARRDRRRTPRISGLSRNGRHECCGGEGRSTLCVARSKFTSAPIAGVDPEVGHAVDQDGRLLRWLQPQI